MENGYDRNAWYKFTDKDGNTYVSRGDNGFVQQSVTEGIPISIDASGNWYTEPFLELTKTGYVGHIPDWFKGTDEYKQWQTFSSQIPNLAVTKDVFTNLQDILKTLGAQGAMRTALTSDIKSYGIKDQSLIDKFVKDIVTTAAEGQGAGAAKLDFFDTTYDSAADLARAYGKLSKEDLSKKMTEMYRRMDEGRKGTWTGTEKDLAEAVTVAKILNYISDNSISYGKDNEFKDLLSSSVWQQINRGLTQFMGGVSSNTFVGIPARVVYGIGNVITGKDFDMKIEDLYQQRLATGADLGAGLEGNEAADVIGMWGGAIGSISVTMATSMLMGSAINAKMATVAPGGFLDKVGVFAQTIPGAAVSDFFLNDVPLDLMLFITDSMRDGIDKAWFDTENPQPLFGIPFIRQASDGNFYPSGLGPDVPGGLALNLVGDAILDAAIPFLGIVGNATYKHLDAMTNGGVTRMREKAALLNLQVQEKLTETPVLGGAWQKFVNHMMGAENAKFIREARKAAIAEGSMDPYVRAQNLLTLANHSSMEIIQPLYKMLDEELGISKSIKKFNAEANKYGGIGETRVEWEEIKDGATKKFYKAVPDTMPKQVKQGLLDVERLSELRGEQANEGGLLTNPARDKEIAEIEARLAETPQEIKDFAERFSELNKRVEAMGVQLGLTTQDWIDALQADPRWKDYMTRQSLTIGGQTIGGGVNPPEASILTAKRKGYYADNYIDPTLALGMKVEALGRAYAWNERAKAMVAFEVSQGKVIAGKGGVQAAERLTQIKEEIKTRTEFRQQIGYDDAIKHIANDTTAVRNAFRKINDQLQLPEKLSLKSVYDSRQNPVIKEMVSDFNNGKITFGDGVKESAGLSDSEAATVVVNTYAYKGMESQKAKIKKANESAAGSAVGTEMKTSSDAAGVDFKSSSEKGAAEVNTPDTLKEPLGKTIDYNAGMTSDGRAFKYDIEDGVITKMTEITDSEGMADALTHVGGAFIVPKDFVDHYGLQISQAVGRTILFYKENMPDIGIPSKFYFEYDGSWGFVPWPNQVSTWNGTRHAVTNPWNIKVANGKIEVESAPVFICSPAYKKGDEARILRDKQEEVSSGRKPKNTATLESTPTHENGHSLINRLAILEVNRKIEEGKLPKLADDDIVGAMDAVGKEIDELEETMIKNALSSLGLEHTRENVEKMATTISGYAAKPVRQKADPNDVVAYSEIFSEAMRMYQGNGQNSSPFCLAIVEQMKQYSERYSVAASPGDVLTRNGLVAPKGLLKDGQYNFPKAQGDKAAGLGNVEKAEWLDRYRQNNPYLKKKGIFTEEDFKKANLWDTFFQKEIRSYDPNSKSAMPDKLAKKNGEFMADLSENAAKRMVQEIKNASVKGFDENIATLVFSRNASDINNAMQDFIVRRINQGAMELAEKMPGGATAENLVQARATLWGEQIVKSEITGMLQTLVPDAGRGDVVSFVDNLFKEQSEGFASVDLLPVETKELIAQKEKYMESLQKENNYARKKGAEVDKASPLKGEHTQIIHYKQDGQDVYAVVSDPVIASVLKRPTDYKETNITVEALANASNFISRAYRIGTTGINPIAFIRNVLRDPMQATIQGGFNPFNMSLSPEMFYRTLRGFGLDDTTIETVTQRLRNWAGASGMTAEMRNMGITTPGSIGYRNQVERVSKKLNKIGESKIIEAAEAPLETWETVFRNQIAQQSFVKNFRRTRDVNKAMGSAMFDASNSTTNFSHSVGMFKRATSTVPYLSSSINGTRSFWVQFNADPIGMVTRITAGFMVPAMAITAWNLSSEERRDTYMNLPEWYKQSHLVLIDLEGNVISFPIPEEIEQYYGTVRKLMEFTQEATPYGIGQILAQGAFGFLPVDVDGFFGEDGSVNFERGLAQMTSGLIPQAATAIYEFFWQKDLFTGQDLSGYSDFQRWLNLGTNVFGTVWKNIVNDIGTLLGVPQKELLGKNTADTLARDLFGVGFDNAKNEFMELVGDPSGVDPQTGKETEATGLFAENEKLQKQIQKINSQIAYSSEEEKPALEKQKEKLINDFSSRIANLTNKYMQLYSHTGGLEEWQKEKIVKLLMLGNSSSSGSATSYQSADASTSYLDERALAQQRYLGAGLPGGPSLEALAGSGSIELQAAINRFYGAPRQATQDYKNAIESTGLKDIRNEFYDAINRIYDIAEANNESPDYDMIEKIQARYLQAVDAVLVPIINQYGVGILNNNDFIDAVRRQVNGMIPSDDWKQSTKNAKRFLSTKEFPTATVDVKKWLKQRYSGSIRNRNIDSDPEVVEQLQSIKADIDAGRRGAAQGKIQSLKNGISKANYYISATDLQTLTKYADMVK